MSSKARKVELLKEEMKTYSEESIAYSDSPDRSKTWWKNIVILMAEIITEKEES